MEVWSRKAGFKRKRYFLTRAKLGVCRSIFLGSLPHAGGECKYLRRGWNPPKGDDGREIRISECESGKSVRGGL